jgi:hypothetical protein
MDPVLTFCLGDEKLMSQVSYNSGKTPAWSDKLIFKRRPEDDLLTV